MLFDKHVKSLAIFTFVTAILSPFNVVALFFTINLLRVDVDVDYFRLKTAVYTKCIILCNSAGIVIAHAVREIVVFSRYRDGRLHPNTVAYIIEVCCWVALYTQPLAIVGVVLYGHYVQKHWLLETVGVEPNVANGVPVTSVVQGHPVSNSALSRFEQLLFQLVNDEGPPRVVVQNNETFRVRV